MNGNFLFAIGEFIWCGNIQSSLNFIAHFVAFYNSPY